ncbi:HAD family hydrolase [Ideonella sp. YS5]|uniref:sulfotransferase-like domain-containing protein n=1 Tax=Ideonella sp. YS5 TaxID=3453714 RepID=UPI003EEA63BC
MSTQGRQPLRVAMWSGPRNISTAMMRSWENRGDCAVSDEPLYAAYLAATGLDHPGREEIIAHGDTDFERVAAALATGPAPDGQPIWYQKHMTHHLLPGHDSSWVRSLVNVFLIRDPAEVVESYLKSRATVEPPDIGLLQQAALFDVVATSQGHAPPVIDADDFLRAPGAYLQALCDRLGIAFTERMLAWPAGPRESDGIWAPHWYDAVWKSTAFEPWRARSPQLSGHALAVAEACRPAYEALRAHRLVLP